MMEGGKALAVGISRCEWGHVLKKGHIIKQRINPRVVLSHMVTGVPKNRLHT